MVSVKRLPNGGYKVRWRDAIGVHRSKTFPAGKLKEARRFYDERIWDRDHGGSGVAPSQVTLLEVGLEFRDRVIHQKHPSTQTLYKWLWNRLIVEQLGHRPINRITVGEIENWLGDLDTGDECKRKAATLLSGVFTFAMKRDYCHANPVSLADRPPRGDSEPPFCPPPEMVERIRRAYFAAKRPRDAYFVSVLAYAGLRPGEARILTWDDWTNDTLIIRAPKTRNWRAAKLLEPLAEDLAEWKTHARTQYMFPGARGGAFTKSAYHNWERRHWTNPAPGVTPYTLRHAYVSLLLRDPSFSRVEIKNWTGHSLEVQDKHYAHVSLAGQGSAVEAIEDARAKVFGSETAETTSEVRDR